MIRVAEPGTLLLFEGRLMRVTGIAEGRMIEMDPVEEEPCATCHRKAQVAHLETSPTFQHLARPVRTIDGTPEP